MLNVDITKAGECLPDLIDQSIDGNRVVITINGKPAVKLVPLTEKRKRRFGSAKGLIKISENFDEPLEDFKGYI